MATRFELILYGQSEPQLRAAGEEALEEIARLEAQLSLYQPTSELSGVNARAASGPVEVTPALFRLLQRARQLSEQTQGAFDITVAPLIRCWGFLGGTGQLPEPSAVEAASELVGMQHVILDEAACTVQFDRPDVMLDLGSIGKGYAVDQAIRILRDNGIESALLHGGTSSIYALGTPPDAEAWAIAIQRPFEPEFDHYLAQIALRDNGLSVSAPHGKWFTAGGRRYGHVIDPRTGWPAGRSLLAAIVLPSATDGDALSTGLLTLGPDWLPRLLELHPNAEALVATEDEDGELQINAHCAAALSLL